MNEAYEAEDMQPNIEIINVYDAHMAYCSEHGTRQHVEQYAACMHDTWQYIQYYCSVECMVGR